MPSDVHTFINPPPPLAIGDWVKIVNIAGETELGTIKEVYPERHGSGDTWFDAKIFLSHNHSTRLIRATHILEHLPKERSTATPATTSTPIAPYLTSLPVGTEITFNGDDGKSICRGRITSQRLKTHIHHNYHYTVELLETAYDSNSTYNKGTPYAMYAERILSVSGVPVTSTPVSGGHDAATKGSNLMPIFDVTVTKKVTKFNAEKTESTAVERVIADVTGIVASDANKAIFIAGTNAKSFDPEDAAAITITTHQRG